MSDALWNHELHQLHETRRVAALGFVPFVKFVVRPVATADFQDNPVYAQGVKRSDFGTPAWAGAARGICSGSDTNSPSGYPSSASAQAKNQPNPARPVRLTSKEALLVKRLRTPAQVQAWLHQLPYNWERPGATARTLRGVVRTGTAHCLEAALTSAAILEHHGYPPTMAYLDSSDHLGHVLHLYKEKGRWGAVARSRCAGLNGRKAVFRSIDALIRSYRAPYIDETGRLTGYALLNLRDLPTSRWRWDAGNVWHVEKALVSAPIVGAGTPEAEFRLWKRRFDVWWEAQGRPHHEWPTYYADKATWM